MSVIHAFHIMWDNFPEPVIITQRSREIIAVNKKAAELGLTAGIKCSSIGRPEDHKGCLCNRAIDENKSVMDSPLQRRPGGRVSGT